MTTNAKALESAKQSLVDTRKELTLLRSGSSTGDVTEAGVKAWEAEYLTRFPGMSYYRVMETQEKYLIRAWHLE